MLNFYLKKTTLFFTSLFFLSALIFAQEPHLLLTSRIGGLTAPIQVVNAGDGTNRLFVVLQKTGTQKSAVLVYDQSYTFLDTFLRITRINTAGNEEGLLSIAFHPEYENAASPSFGFFYVYYTSNQGDLQIARYSVSANPNIADTMTKDTLITISHPSNSNHNGGTINFGNDGYLYVATGDGGGGGDVPNNAQRADVLLGKMLRFNVNSVDSIPPDNPYVGITSPDTLDAIYAFGLRNPFRWSFDRATNDIWIGDVGQGAWEEINFRVADSTARSNYGWRCYEGNANYNTSVGCTGPLSKYVFPVHVYPNPGGAAITGGVVYRGTVPANAPLVGHYLASDYYSGNMYKIKPNGSGGWTVYVQNDAGVKGSIAHFGEAEDGEIFAVSQFPNNAVYSIIVDDVLPVRLIDFTATVLNKAVQLKWKTTFEENVSRFEIEFSTDGTIFHQAGSVAAANATAGAEYQFSHTPSNPGRVLYRLKMIDIDNSFEYSGIVSIETGMTDKNFVRPSLITSGVINVFLNSPFNTIELISMNGEILLKQNINGRTGRIDIPVSFVASGMYVVQLRNNETTLQQKVIIR